MKGRGRILTLAAFLAATLCAIPASAEPVGELIPRLIDDGGWLRPHYPGQKEEKPGSPRFGWLESSAAVLGSELHIAIIARDWSEAYSLTDGRALLFDRVRLIRSNRMAVTRVSMAGGTFLPYAEMSFGQWRADTDLVPWLKSDLEAAAQVAGGIEVRFAPRCAFAWDVEETKIYPAQDRNVPATRLFASFAALHVEF
jgi:hypothetical protein